MYENIDESDCFFSFFLIKHKCKLTDKLKATSVCTLVSSRN